MDIEHDKIQIMSIGFIKIFLFFCRCRSLSLEITQPLDGWFMLLSTTFNNISVIMWWSVLLVEETGVPRENHQPVASH